MTKKILFVFMIITLLICSTSIVQANSISEIMTGADNFISNGSSTSTISGDKLKELSDTIYNVLLIIGTVIAVIIGAVLGIQFITGSVEQKAKVKDSLIPFIVGCVIIFGAFGIWKLVVEIGASVSTTSPNGTSQTTQQNEKKQTTQQGETSSTEYSNMSKNQLKQKYKQSGIETTLSKWIKRGDLNSALTHLSPDEKKLYNAALNAGIINKKGQVY